MSLTMNIFFIVDKVQMLHNEVFSFWVVWLIGSLDWQLQFQAQLWMMKIMKQNMEMMQVSVFDTVHILHNYFWIDPEPSSLWMDQERRQRELAMTWTWFRSKVGVEDQIWIFGPEQQWQREAWFLFLFWPLALAKPLFYCCWPLRLVEIFSEVSCCFAPQEFAPKTKLRLPTEQLRISLIFYLAPWTLLLGFHWQVDLASIFHEPNVFHPLRGSKWLQPKLLKQCHGTTSAWNLIDVKY